jgi:transcriptional regulator with PAS, ATPase and Fis domain
MSDPEVTSLIGDQAGPKQLHLRRLRLIVKSGPEAGLDSLYDHEVVRIGKEQGNHLLLSDTTVSRNHAEVVRTRHGILLRDLGSTNGTFVGPVRIKEVYLGDGRVFQVGQTEVEFRVMDEVVDIVPAAATRFEGLVGQSVTLREVFSVLDRVGRTDLTVLVTGETGTGKELVSRAIHLRSKRSKGPFVVFDCAAVAKNLVESELFGHIKGAFTGAVQDRAGVFEQAHRGTVFIDELGELPLELQPALLRVLEQREVRRVGDRVVRPIDVRVVAATNRDLKAMVAAGTFREDLYYRLAVVEVNLPPLRDRREDFPLLIEHALLNAPFPHEITGVAPEVEQVFAAYHWPGNIRELRNVILRAIPFSEGYRITLDALPEAMKSRRDVETDVESADIAAPSGELSLKEAKDVLVEAFEKRYLEDLLERCGGNVSQAARQAGVDRKTITRLLKRHNISH